MNSACADLLRQPPLSLAVYGSHFPVAYLRTARPPMSGRWSAARRHQGGDAGVFYQGLHIVAETIMQDLGPVTFPHMPKGCAPGHCRHVLHPRGEVIVG